MQQVTGIGGIFLRARDPEALARWYSDHLGIPSMVDGGSASPWWTEAGHTVFAAFPSGTDYFGRADQEVMLNFRVTDLDAMLAQLRAAGAEVDDKVELLEGIGRFGWVTDPEGNRIELWEPSPEITPP
jgi:predicted enzyme related to lactoylglutathione lyase